VGTRARARAWMWFSGTTREKEHSAWRNLGSWLTNRLADWMLDKPRGFYLSSFRCARALVARAVAEHTGPFPYIDGLILQITQRIGSLEVRHEPRQAGQSGYTLRKLVRLWLSTFCQFLGDAAPAGDAAGPGSSARSGCWRSSWSVYWHATEGTPWGWGSLMAAMLVFSGTQADDPRAGGRIRRPDVSDRESPAPIGGAHCGARRAGGLGASRAAGITIR